MCGDLLVDDVEVQAVDNDVADVGLNILPPHVKFDDLIGVVKQLFVIDDGLEKLNTCCTELPITAFNRVELNAIVGIVEKLDRLVIGWHGNVQRVEHKGPAQFVVG